MVRIRSSSPPETMSKPAPCLWRNLRIASDGIGLDGVADKMRYWVSRSEGFGEKLEAVEEIVGEVYVERGSVLFGERRRAGLRRMRGELLAGIDEGANGIENGSCRGSQAASEEQGFPLRLSGSGSSRPAAFSSFEIRVDSRRFSTCCRGPTLPRPSTGRREAWICFSMSLQHCWHGHDRLPYPTCRRDRPRALCIASCVQCQIGLNIGLNVFLKGNWHFFFLRLRSVRRTHRTPV